MKTRSVLLAISMTFAFGQSAHAISLTMMSTIPTPNSSGGIAYGVSSDGKFLAGFSVGGQSITPVRWDSNGAVTSFGFDSGFAVGISGDGNRLVGNAYENGQPTTFLVDVGSHSITRNLFKPNGQYGNDVTGISADGKTVVGSRDGAAVSWTESTGTVVLQKGNIGSARVNAVNQDGTVMVGGLVDPSPINTEYGKIISPVARWINGELDIFAPLSGQANGVSASGGYIVGSASTSAGTQAYLWSDSGTILLGDLGGGEFYSSAAAVSEDGKRVVGFSRDGGSVMIPNTAFLWEADTGMRSLSSVLQASGVDLGGCLLQNATAISPDGRYISGGAYCSGSPKYGYGGFGYLVDLGEATSVPEPTTISLVMLGAALLGGTRKRLVG